MEQALKSFDSCRGSVLHQLLTRPVREGSGVIWSKFIMVYAIVSILPGIYNFIYLAKPWVFKKEELVVPFLKDSNALFMTLCLFPVILYLLLHERDYIAANIMKVYRNNVLKIDADKGKKILDKWQEEYRTWNIRFQMLSLFIVAWIVYYNYGALTDVDFIGWQSDAGTPARAINASGMLFLFWQLPAVWFVFSFFILRAFVTAFFLKGLARESKFQLVFFHPDNAGGLGPIGRIGLRNQYALAAGGINLFFCLSLALKQRENEHMVYLSAAAALAYIVAAPLLFMGPLLPFRRSMKDEKEKSLSEITEALNSKYEKACRNLKETGISKEDESEMARLQNICTQVYKMPVWPFDTVTMKRFVTAYLAPILFGLATKYVNNLFGLK